MDLSEKLAERLKSVDKSGIEKKLRDKRRGTGVDWAYRQAAAVLSRFEFEKLRPFGESIEHDETTAQMRLMSDCLPADDRNTDEWTLKHPIRKAALTKLNTKAALNEALRNYSPRPANLLQRTLENCIKGTLPPLEDQSLQQLRNTHQVIDWLSATEVATDLPKPEDIGRLIEWRQLLEPFHYLAGDHFRGRVKELEQLRKHVFEDIGTPPLLVYGPGGTGKSTLLSKFIIDSATDLSDPNRIPFTYIDFDRLVASPEEPLTLLMESARQLAIQYPSITEQARYFIEEWSYQLNAEDARSVQTNIAQNVMPYATKGGGTIRSQLDPFSGYFYDFMQLLVAAGLAQDVRFLFVLDTFEEIQFRSRDQVRDLSSFFSAVGLQIPGLRIVIAGRGLITEGEMDVTPMQLGEFDEAASTGYLQYKGIENDTLAEEIFRLVGGNPLSLKLASDLVRNEELSVNQSAGIDELKSVLRRVEENNIQGQLYRRILEHIKKPEARMLAHPGLTLRYVSAELIKEVLAEPCGLGAIDDFKANQLFEILRNEVSLVTPDQSRPDVLRHRSDVRAVMIQALQNDEPFIVHEIHRGAIQYYERFDDPQSRAEEIYHRLFAESDFSRAEERWKPGWEEHLYQALRPALTEFPPAAQAWLAGRLGITGVEIDWDETDLRDWERLARKRIEDMIFSSRFDDAYALLSERKERTAGSPLYYYETLILIQQKRWKEARRCVKEGLFSMRQAHDDEQLLTLLKQAIQIDMELKHFGQAQREIEQARKLLKHDEDRQTTEMEFSLYEFKIKRSIDRADTEGINRLKYQLFQDFTNLSDRHLRSNPRMVRLMLAEFAEEDIDVLRRGLKIMTLGNPSPEQREAIGRAMARWNTAYSEYHKTEPGEFLEILGQSVSDTSEVLPTWLAFAINSKSRELSDGIQVLLDKFGVREIPGVNVASILGKSLSSVLLEVDS